MTLLALMLAGLALMWAGGRCSLRGRYSAADTCYAVGSIALVTSVLLWVVA